MEFYDSILGWVIILGSVVPYGVQYYKIYKTRSVEGISGLMLLSGCISSFFSLLAIVFNNFYLIRDTENYEEKYLLSIPVIQLATPFTLLEINYLLYFLYSIERKPKIIYILWHLIQLPIFTIIFPLLIYFLYNINSVYIIFNVISGVFSVVMWIPQIIITIKKREPGSLSITSLIIQAIGCISVIVFQLLDGTSPTIIIPYVIGALSEITLVIICTYYQCRPIQSEDIIVLDESLIQSNNIWDLSVE